VLWKALSSLGRDDAPLLLRPKALPSLGLWGLEFLRNSAPRRYLRNALRNARLAAYSLAVLRALRKDTGIRYDESARGTLKLFRDRKSMERSAAVAETLSGQDVTYRLLDPAGVVEVEPALAPVRRAVVGGILYPHDESGDAHQFCRALCQAAQDRGGQFLFNTTVTALRHNGRHIAAVDTSAGPFQADAFVVAAGSCSPVLVRPLGLRLPIRPVKGYSITLPRGGWQEGPMSPVVDDSLHAAVTPLGDRLRVGSAAFFIRDVVLMEPDRPVNFFSLGPRVFVSSRDLA
jgi:D-amino-acid dehydrogenase